MTNTMKWNYGTGGIITGEVDEPNSWLDYLIERAQLWDSQRRFAPTKITSPDPHEMAPFVGMEFPMSYIRNKALAELAKLKTQ